MREAGGGAADGGDCKGGHILPGDLDWAKHGHYRRKESRSERQVHPALQILRQERSEERDASALLPQTVTDRAQRKPCNTRKDVNREDCKRDHSRCVGLGCRPGFEDPIGNYEVQTDIF